MLARLGTQPETLDNAEHLYQKAAINTLAELESGADWSEAIANLVFHLDNDLPRIKNLIVNMLKKRDQWLRHVVQDHDRNDMEQSLVRLVEDQLIRRDSSADDRRVQQVSLTSKGRKALNRMIPAHSSWVKDLMNSLDTESALKLHGLLGDLKSSIQKADIK